MKRIYTVGLCLVAMSALGAAAASSASAGELLARVAGGGGVAGTTFLAQAVLPLVWTHSGNVVHCALATSHGLFLSAVLGDILIRYLGCTVNGLACNTNGAGAGEIHVPLSTLFVLGLAHLTLTTGSLPAALILSNLIVVKCGMISVEIKGNAIGALQRGGAPVPLNTPFLDVNLNFQQTAPGLQHLRLFLFPGTVGPSSFDLELRAGLFGRQELASEVANALVDLFRLSDGTHIDIELVEP
jgi:hypothetical protein